jgi:beta-lactamase superfamily II metal-dependent hydrolase
LLGLSTRPHLSATSGELINIVAHGEWAVNCPSIAAGEAHLLASGRLLDADVLKVGHHGSGGSTSREFLQAVGPQYAVISVGYDNYFGHPAPALLERLDAMPGLAVLRTDEAGTVEFITKGQHFGRLGRLSCSTGRLVL